MGAWDVLVNTCNGATASKHTYVGEEDWGEGMGSQLVKKQTNS